MPHFLARDEITGDAVAFYTTDISSILVPGVTPDDPSKDDYSRYLTVRGVAQMLQNEAFVLQSDAIPFPEDVWEGIVEALENVRTCLAALREA